MARYIVLHLQSSHMATLNMSLDPIMRYILYCFFQGALTIETKAKFHILEMVDAPPRPFLCPFPHKGLVYDYRFIKKVRP